MACSDVLSLEDLQTAKKHKIFEAEVITGKVGVPDVLQQRGVGLSPCTGCTPKPVVVAAGAHPQGFTLAANR